jgi:hypothetical protein
MCRFPEIRQTDRTLNAGMMPEYEFHNALFLRQSELTSGFALKSSKPADEEGELSAQLHQVVDQKTKSAQPTKVCT